MCSKIFQTLPLGKYILKNRIAIPPLVVFNLPEAGDQVQEAHLTHYKKMSNGGAALLVVESITTNPVHEKRAMIGAYDERFIPGLTRLANVCKENKTIALAQITNTGLELMPYKRLSQMPATEFKQYRDEFVKAAVICKKAGFHGVELHGAHGFYLNQILELNDRDDEYGDGIEVLQDMIREIKELCGKDFLVQVRIGNHDIEALIQTARALEAAGADSLHISRGAWEDGDGSLSKHEDDMEALHAPAPIEALPQGFGYDYTVYMASRVKPFVSIPVICVGGMRKQAQVEEALEKGYADLVALGRQHLADPAWTNKIAAGQEPDYCINCKFCKWMNDGTGQTCAARIIASRKKRGC